MSVRVNTTAAGESQKLKELANALAKRAAQLVQHIGESPECEDSFPADCEVQINVIVRTEEIRVDVFIDDFGEGFRLVEWAPAEAGDDAYYARTLEMFDDSVAVVLAMVTARLAL